MLHYHRAAASHIFFASYFFYLAGTIFLGFECTRLFHENEDPCRDYNISFKGRNPRVLESRPNYSSLLLSFSRPPVSRSLSLMRPEKSIQGGFACIFIVSTVCAGCSSPSSASPLSSRLSLTLTLTMSREYKNEKEWRRHKEERW